MTVSSCKNNKYQQYSQQHIVNYYSHTSADYEGWSKDYNMHFGYFKFKNWRQCLKEIWRLEPQLQQTNYEVFNTLKIKDNGYYLDMGCGLGASARYFAGIFPKARLTGITIVDNQVKKAQKLLHKKVPHAQNVDFQNMDFQNMTFPSGQFDGVYALESICYARGARRSDFLAEAYRVLKPNGKIVIHDAFTLTPTKNCNALYRYAYHWLCKGWAVDDYINKTIFEEELKRQGFINIQFKNAFWNVLPSALHIPRIVTTYAIKKILFSKDFYTNEKLRKQRINHLLSSIAAIFVPLHVKHFGYYIVTAKKKE